MLNYDLIKNERLKLLVMVSESINSLPAEEIQKMIEKIAAAPEEIQKEIMASLEAEQKEIQKTKLAIGITPEMEKREIEEQMQKITTIKKGLEHVVHEEEQKNEARDAQLKAEAVLNKL